MSLSDWTAYFRINRFPLLRFLSIFSEILLRFASFIQKALNSESALYSELGKNKYSVLARRSSEIVIMSMKVNI